MKYLLDSNVLYWTFSDPKKLSARVRRIVEDDESSLYTSRTSIWELSAKAALGRLDLLGSSIQPLIDQIALAGLDVLELCDRYILRTQTLPHHHSDRFDRIIVAQALQEGLTILTSDSDIPKYGVPVIWK